jgi:hypothetical protein
MKIKLIFWALIVKQSLIFGYYVEEPETLSYAKCSLRAGSSLGIGFDDWEEVQAAIDTDSTFGIAKLKLCAAEDYYLGKIEVTYNRGGEEIIKTHGSGDGFCEELTLSPGEFFTEVTIFHDEDVGNLRLITTESREVFAGYNFGTDYQDLVNRVVIAFKGHLVGNHISYLQVYTVPLEPLCNFKLINLISV